MARKNYRTFGKINKPSTNQEVGTELVNFMWTPGLTGQDDFELSKPNIIPTVAQLQAMRRTNGQAMALYRLVTLPIRAAMRNISFIPVKGQTGGTKEAKFIQQALTLPSASGGMETPLSLVITQMLNGLYDGFSAFEKVYQNPKTGPLKGKFTLKKIAYRPSTSITVLVDKNGEWTGFKQYANLPDRIIDIKIDRDYAVRYVAQPELNPVYGESFFTPAFIHYDQVRRYEFIATQAAKRSALGTRIGREPAGVPASVSSAFSEALGRVEAAQYIKLPPGFEVDIIKDAVGFPFLDMINYHLSQMSKSVLAQFFDQSQGASGGQDTLVDFGRSEDTYFYLMLATIQDDIAAVINEQIIAPLVYMNFGPNGKPPVLTFGGLTDEEKKLMYNLFKTVVTAGQTSLATPEFILELEKKVSSFIGLEIDYDTIEKEVAEQKALAEELAAKQRELQMKGLEQSIQTGNIAVGQDGVAKANLPDPRQNTNNVEENPQKPGPKEGSVNESTAKKQKEAGSNVPK